MKVTRTQTLVTLATIVACVAFFALVPAARETVGQWIAILSTGDTEKAMTAFKDYLLGFGVWAPIVSSLLMIFQSVVAPLPAFVITFTNGLLFGWGWGALLSWSSAMAGAVICFYIARFLGRPVVEKLVGGTKALEVSDLFFEKYGDRAVLISRLLPFVSFDIISYGAGLTPIEFWKFFIATGVGQLPATLVYSYLGQNLTGSVKVLFWVFSITIVIFVAASAMRPAYMRRLRARAAGKAAGGESGVEGGAGSAREGGSGLDSAGGAEGGTAAAGVAELQSAPPGDATPRRPRLAWYAPAVPVAILGALAGLSYLAVDTFSRDLRLVMNALKGEDVSTMRQVLYGFGTWQPAWGYLATVLRMLTAPWSLGALSEALVGRLGPGLGWTILVLGVLTGLLVWGALILTVVLGTRAFLRRKRG